MASSNIAYCTDNDLLDVYPNISGYDLKRRIYGWKDTDTTNQYQAFNTGLINQLYFDGIEGTSVTDNPNAIYEWNYSSSTDSVQVFHTSKDPNDMIIEAGEDWETIKTRFRKKACRLFESEIDSRFVREISKDREGNYPDIVVRATALKTVILLMKAHDPENAVINSFDMEYNEIVRGIKSGSITLPNSITQDSGKGVIREVSVNGSTTLRPVSIIGEYQGSGYDLLKIVVSTAGAIGAAKMTVYQKDGDKLKTDASVEAELIDGDYQYLAPGLRIRWSAAVIDGSTDVATLNDEYEVEVYGQNIDSTQHQVGTVSLTRRQYH